MNCNGDEAFSTSADLALGGMSDFPHSALPACAAQPETKVESWREFASKLVGRVMRAADTSQV